MPAILFFIIAALAAGCAAPGGDASGTGSDVPVTAAKGSSTAGYSTASPAGSPASGTVIAYIAGQPVSTAQLQPLLLEAAGGQVLRELVLDRMIDRRLLQRKLAVDDAMLENEQRLLLKSLHADGDEAARLLRQLREDRGLGQERFARLIARNAKLRLLAQENITIDEPLVRQQFDLVHGPRYEARLIVTASQSAAAAAYKRAQAGESFIDLAVELSTDPSRAQGGLMPPISPADATWPGAIRTALQRMEVGEISNPIALEDGFAILRLERKIEAEPADYDDVKEAMTERARRLAEQLEMQRLVQTLIREADVVILDPTLETSWRTRR